MCVYSMGGAGGITVKLNKELQDQLVCVSMGGGGHHRQAKQGAIGPAGVCV